VLTSCESVGGAFRFATRILLEYDHLKAPR
jgi:hypothetical protein